MVSVVGPPVAAGICHCETCRTWHAAPLNAYAVWLNKDITVTKGEGLLVNYQSERSNRHWCRHCGSGIMNRLNDEVSVVYAMVLAGSGYVHKPSRHIYCEETVFDVQDGVPKYFDLPSELGGSGKVVEEPLRTGMRLPPE